MSELPGECLLNGCYSIEKVLGRGGFGITYLATDTKLNLPVAVKEYLPEAFSARSNDLFVEPFENKRSEFEWGLSRFLSEAQILAQFKHPNIVRVNAAFEQYGTAYMVMEYERGVSLADYLRQNDSDRSQKFFEKFMFSILNGLQGIHDKGFIHRDIKPANLMVRADSENTPVLIDFGSARSTTGSETGALTAVTTAGYSPIEQHNTDMGEQGPWTDIYALAAAIREGITGEVPPLSLTREFAARADAEDDPLRPLAKTWANRGYSHEFLQALDWGMAIMPHDRPQSLGDWKRSFYESTTRPTGPPGSQQQTVVRDPSEVETVVSPRGESITEARETAYAEKSTALDGTLLDRTGVHGSENRDLAVPERGVAVKEHAISKERKAKTGGFGLKAGVVAVVAGLAVWGMFQMRGTDPEVTPATDEITSPDVATTQEAEPSPEVATKEEIEPSPDVATSEEVESTPDVATSEEVEPGPEVATRQDVEPSPEVSTSEEDEPGADIATTESAELSSDVAVEENLDLPRPETPIELISPEDRIKQEVMALNAAADPFVQLIGDDGSVPDVAVEPIDSLLLKYKLLSESEIVRTSPALRSEVMNGLEKISVVNAAAANQIKESLNASATVDVAEIDELLVGWKSLAAEQRSRMIFALASLSDEQRAALQNQTELKGMTDEMNLSIKSKIESRDFQSAARLLEVAMTVSPGDESLEFYKSLIELK